MLSAGSGRPQVVLIYGQYGAGKTTLGRALEKETGVPHISCGDVTRVAERKKTGEWLSCDEMLALFSIPPRCTMDGYPRLLEHVQHFVQHVDVKTLLFIRIPDEVAEQRVEARWRLLGNPTDAPNHRQKRAQLHHEREPAVIAFFKERGVPIHYIDGTKTKEDVLAQAKRALRL